MKIARGLKSLGASLSGLLLLAGAAAAQSAADWEALTGPWRGEGFLRQNPSEDLERGVCRVEVRSGAEKDGLEFAGRCANATRSARFKTSFTRSSKAGKVQAVSESRALPGRIVLGGTWSDRRMKLRSAEPVTLKDRAYNVLLTVDQGKDKTRFSMVQALEDVETGALAKVLEMTFVKK